MAKYIVLLGPPGAGKGTQAQIISKTLSLAHISSGDIFRENLKNETDLGKLAQGYMTRGELVPDDVTIAMICDRLQRADCVQGALLDGFPRTPAQAEALSVMLADWNAAIDCVPYIYVDADVLIERLSGRWTCPICGLVTMRNIIRPFKKVFVIKICRLCISVKMIRRKLLNGGLKFTWNKLPLSSLITVIAIY